MKFTAMEILFCLLAGLPVLKANDPTGVGEIPFTPDKNSPFYYDWKSLRLGGLIFAGVLCFLGIVILLSGKCKCKPKRRSSTQISVAPKRPLRGETSEC